MRLVVTVVIARADVDEADGGGLRERVPRQQSGECRSGGALQEAST